MIKLKDIFNINKNKNNKQVSFSLRKRELKQNDLDIDDILDMEIKSNKDFLKDD